MIMILTTLHYDFRWMGIYISASLMGVFDGKFWDMLLACPPFLILVGKIKPMQRHHFSPFFREHMHAYLWPSTAPISAGGKASLRSLPDLLTSSLLCGFFLLVILSHPSFSTPFLLAWPQSLAHSKTFHGNSSFYNMSIFVIQSFTLLPQPVFLWSTRPPTLCFSIEGQFLLSLLFYWHYPTEPTQFTLISDPFGHSKSSTIGAASIPAMLDLFSSPSVKYISLRWTFVILYFTLIIFSFYFYIGSFHLQEGASIF